jgi:hypothetical protein
MGFVFPTFTVGLFLLHFSPTMSRGVCLSTPNTPLKYFSCTFSTSSGFFPSPDLCLILQYSLYHAHKHHHSPPEITSPLSFFYSPNTSHYVPYFFTISQISALSVAHSLVEHHHFRLLNIHFQHFLPRILSQALHHFFHFSFALKFDYKIMDIYCQ